ncbi:hypothetical protein [Allobranchiibius sp. GilTou38]|nr:hypothetical protein [Allobranchiibius sp. GilTou38]MBO1768235.1 hypothetical protein [Allobranchiibius sp. GilTou38]
MSDQDASTEPEPSDETHEELPDTSWLSAEEIKEGPKPPTAPDTIIFKDQ